MLYAIILDENQDKKLINYIESFRTKDGFIDYNSILINLLNKGLENKEIEIIKQSIQDSILLKVNDEIKNIIKNELNDINRNSSSDVTNIMDKTANTLDLILDKLNNTQFIANINNNIDKNNHSDENMDENNETSEYDKHVNKTKKEININVDINPLLANILNNANR